MMRGILVVVFFTIVGNYLFAQDVIYKQNGDEIKSKIIEITFETIKYKEFDFQDGPTKHINASEVFMIIYESGKRELITPIKGKNSTQVSEQYIVDRADEEDDNKKNEFMIGPGYGNSYGGFGCRIQWKRGRELGYGFHFGVGYFPEAPMLASAGIKLFFEKHLYFNTQFGFTGWEVYDSNKYSHFGDGSYHQILYGPSILVGGDWTCGKKAGLGFNFGLGATYNINVVNQGPLTLAFDSGLIIWF
ncbi:MAG: hypothetical protein K9H64_16445 [Bacteroidales bacterium]|nr:hypothetical protein [Bacteroidales bacterium]MCF8457560.1 hypothetical protein [Bacteroidales bacterium]